MSHRYRNLGFHHWYRLPIRPQMLRRIAVKNRVVIVSVCIDSQRVVFVTCLAYGSKKYQKLTNGLPCAVACCQYGSASV